MKIFRNIKQGIKNLWKWLPIIWNDRNWDQYYLYKLLHFKFKNMEFFFRNYGCFIGNEKVADQIKVCKLLLERIIKDNYADKMYKSHDKKWGEAKIRWETLHEEYEGYSELFIDREKVTEKNEEKERKEFLRICNHEDMMRKQDIEYLCKCIKRHVQGWWD